MADWSDLRIFLEVVRSGTLTAAGRKLALDGSTVGRRIAALERDLGARLFSRRPDGLRPTAAAEAIRTAAEEMEEAALRLERRALGSDRKLSGQVRVATTEMLASLVVLPAVRVVHERHPQIRVELVTGAARLDVARREADIALRYVRPDRGDVIGRRVGAVAYAVYASKGYLAARGRPERGAGFSGHDLVAYAEGIRAWRPESSLAGESIGDARVVLRANSALSLFEAVRLGIGIGAVPCWLADRDEDLERVFAAVDQDDIWIVVHADVQRTGRVRAVIEAIDERVAEVRAELAGERRA